MVKETKNIPVENDSVEQVFIQHKKGNQFSLFKKSRVKIFFASIFTGILILFGMYLLSDISKINGIKVIGNTYLSNEEIIQIAEVSTKSRKIFIFDSIIKNNAKKNPLIDKIEIKFTEDDILEILVTEKKLIGYRYDKTAMLITSDAKLIEMNEDLSRLIVKLPFVVGFDPIEDENGKLDNMILNEFAASMSQLKTSTIENISEIHQISFSYDSAAIQCIMRDGNEVYGDFYTISLLDDYNFVADKLSPEKNCLYLVVSEKPDGKKVENYFKSTCPYDVVENEEDSGETN